MNTKKILIVEDDKWLAEQHARVLKKAGLQPIVTLHAVAAIKAVDDDHPDAIVLDVLLTGSTAFAFMHELQSYSDTGKIPIILCTNLAGDLLLDDVAPYGVRKILDKTTMAPDDLAAAVRSLFL
jgi:DNA-binding response OmpR family regulator